MIASCHSDQLAGCVVAVGMVASGNLNNCSEKEMAYAPVWSPADHAAGMAPVKLLRIGGMRGSR